MDGKLGRHLVELGRLVQKAGPYVVLEVVLPGGTLFALLLYLHRTGQLRRIEGAALMAAHVAGRALGAFAFALQPAGSLRAARRNDGLELQMLAACR